MKCQILSPLFAALTVGAKKSLILKIMGQIQARTMEIPTLDDMLQEMLSNYKKKSRK